jgi:hypothetical protein
MLPATMASIPPPRATGARETATDCETPNATEHLNVTVSPAIDRLQEAEDALMAATVANGRAGRRALIVPIDPERDTRWALVELLFGLQRDARERWHLIRCRRWLKRLGWALGTIASSFASMAVDHHFHLTAHLLQRFG